MIRNTQKLMILEDAQFGTLKQRGTSQFTTEQPFLFQINLLGRYIGLKIMETVQGLTQVSDFLKQNSGLIIVKNLHSLKECYEAGNLLNIKEKEKCEELINLKINEAYVIDKMRSSTGVKVITNDFPNFTLTIYEINQIQESNMKEILSHVVFKDDSINIKSIHEEELNYFSEILIQDLKRFPFEFQSEREIRLNMNARIIADNLDDLVMNKWLYRYENKISLGKGKGQFQPYVFTEKAIQEIGKQEIKGKGSIEHAFWQYRCAKYFIEKGYDVKIEYFPSEENNSGNKSSLYSIDVIAQNDYEKIALEIELRDNTHIKDNILKCINGSFDKIIIAVYGAKLMKRIQRIALSNIEIEKRSKEGKIKIEMLSSFLN